MECSPLSLTLCWLVITSLLNVVTSRPTGTHDNPTSQTAPPGSGNHGDCVVHLRSRIERCLHRYQQILITYQAVGTTQDQRARLRERLCHQYQVTLQCLHENLAMCPPRAEHFRLIEDRIGNLRGYMAATCQPGPRQDKTPKPTTTTTALPTSTTTQYKTTKPRRITHRPTTRPPTVRPFFRDFENNSFKGGYTVKNEDIGSNIDSSATTGRWKTTTTPHTVAPSGVKTTSEASPTKFQLLFGYHGNTKTVVNPSVGASNTKIDMEHGGDVDKNVPVQVLSFAGTIKQDPEGLQDKQVSEKLDCSVDENNKIDVRCVFSGSQRLSTSWTTSCVLLTFMATWFLNKR